MDPVKTSQETPQNHPEDRSKKKKLKIIAIAVVIVLVLGGITSALVVRSIYNRPENVLASSLGNFLLDGKDKNFDTKVTLGLEEAVMGAEEISFDAKVQMAGKTTQIDLKVDTSVIKLSGALQSNENGSLYVKIDDLPTLIASGAASGIGLTAEQADQLKELDGEWIEIKQEDLSALTDQQAGSSTLDKCTEALYGALDNNSLADKVDSEYKKNKFLLAKTDSMEMVGERELLKIEVGFDRTKYDNFVKKMSESKDFTKAIEACGLSESNTSGQVSSDNTQKDELKNAKVTVWVDRSKKELVKMSMGGDAYRDGQKEASLEMVMDVNKPQDRIEAPTDTVNLMTLLESFGLDPRMINSSGL